MPELDNDAISREWMPAVAMPLVLVSDGEMKQLVYSILVDAKEVRKHLLSLKYHLPLSLYIIFVVQDASGCSCWLVPRNGVMVSIILFANIGACDGRERNTCIIASCVAVACMHEL